jgi:hypothetical protein
MKRLAAAAVLVFVALPLPAAEKWWDAYNRGVKAVNARQYEAGADALQRAIAEMPVESTAARTRSQIITYVPHFFLGIARFNLGDVDGAMREWKTSEEQGAIQNTDYYARLKEWVARAKTETQRLAQNAAAGSKKAADAALSRALTGQMEAVSAGGDRSDNYRTGQRRLQDALDQFNKAGSDVRAYNRVGEMAAQARDLFAAAAEDAKKQKAARPAVVAAKQPAPPPVTLIVPMTDTVIEQAPAAAPPVVQPPVPAPPVESEARIATRVALQKFRQRLMMIYTDPQYASVRGDLAREEKLAAALEARLSSESTDAALQQVNTEIAARERDVSFFLERAASRAAVISEAQSTHSQLESAYRAFASGNLTVSEDLLTRILTRAQSSEAYLLRGCTRYTRAMLSTKPDDLLVGAKLDFREALKINRSLRLNATAFSPKLVKFFDEIRKGS